MLHPVANKTNIYLFLLLLITIGAFFVRSYNFSDLLLFKSDQARDSYFARDALHNGVGHLRVFGPDGGDAVFIKEDSNLLGDKEAHLGPIYYYFQCIAGYIFQNTEPYIFAIPDLFFAILAIPLFYYFLRHFFDDFVSFLASTLFSSSFFLVQHSRFAWNPNPLIFWEILFLLSVYKASATKDKKRAGVWLVVLFVSLAVISQLHFLALFGFPVILVFYWLFYRPKNIAKKYWAIAIGLFLLLYSPVIASEIVNNGDNMKRIIAQTRNEGQIISLDKRISKTIMGHGAFYSFSLSSYNKHAISNIKVLGVAFIFLSLSLITLSLMKKKPKFLRFLPRINRSFLLLSLIYFLVFFFVYFRIPLLLGKQRYWLVTGVVPFLFFAFWISIIVKYKNKRMGATLSLIIVLVLVISNMHATVYFYKSLEKGYKITTSFRNKSTMRPYSDLVVYGQMKDAVDYMSSFLGTTNKALCYSTTIYQNKRGFEYIIDNSFQNITVNKLRTKDIPSDCLFFIITESDKNQATFHKEVSEVFGVSNFKIIGAITIWHLTPNDEYQTEKEAINETNNIKWQEHLWKDLF